MKKFNLSKGLFAGLLTLALCFALFGVTKASADGSTSGSAQSTSGSGNETSTSGNQTEAEATEITSAVYDAASDSVIFTANGKGSVYYTTFKTDAGGELDPAKLKSVSLTKDGNSYTAEVSVSDKNGLKTAVNKDTYLYYVLVKPKAAEGSKKVQMTPTLTIKKTPIKKLVINVDYVKVAEGSEELAISSIEITPFEGDKEVYSANDTGDKLAKFYEYVDRLQYGADAKTVKWLPVIADEAEEEATSGSASGTSTSGSGDANSGAATSSSASGTPTADSGFTYDLVSSKVKSGAKFQFRIAGTASERGSKPVKVSIKKAAKAITKMTFDVSANAAVIKNGYDFAVYKKAATSSASGSSSSASGTSSSASGLQPSGGSGTVIEDPNKGGIATWFTVLPVNKNATQTDFIKATAEYVPYKKIDSAGGAAAMFTKTKVKSVLVSTLFEKAEADISSDTLYLYVRKSAGVGKPAGIWSSKFEVKCVAGKPVPDLAKAGEKTIGTKDSKDLYKAKFSAASGDTGSTFEILVVKSTDYDENLSKINFTTAKWTKYNASKGFKIGVRSKYALKSSEDGKAQNAELADGDYILVRRTGDKKSGKLASNYVVTKINGDKWQVLNLSDGKAPAGGSTSGSGSGSGSSTGSGSGTSSGS
ncbi:MAG: hypothetical protein K6G81_07175 [Lachnospiraceae bacterium]|nr:hypothetical protein [Lachnospiraceae bacterium]